MQSESNNTTDEFSPVLRRHLREQVAVECPGFDADLAAAYLEQALVSFVCRQFEEHLAGCPPCRGHLLQLARLASPAEVPAASISPVLPARIPEADGVMPAATGYWWQSGQWLADLTAFWRRPVFGPALALTTAAAVVAAVLWQWPGARPANPTSSGEMIAGMAGKPEPREVGLYSGGPASQDASQDLDSPQTSARSANPQETGATPGGTPVSPRSESQRAARSAPRRTPGSEADPAARQLASGSAPAPVGEPATPILQLPIQPRIAATDLLGQLESAGPGFSALGRQSGDSGLMTVTNMQGKTSSAPARDRNPFNSAGPFSGYGGVISNSFALPATGRSRSGGGETIPVASVKILRGKTFVFNGRYWVDQLSRELMTSRGTVELVFGDEKYQQVVSENPGLAAYFELRPVIVVWNGRIYRVTAR